MNMVVLNQGLPLQPQITVPRLHGQPIKLESLGQSIFKAPQMIPVPLTLRFFPSSLCPTKFCVVLYILFRWSGTPARSQLCSARSSVSGGVFLTYPWREMYSKSTYFLDLPQMTTMSSHGSSIGLAKKFVQVFRPLLWKKPK